MGALSSKRTLNIGNRFMIELEQGRSTLQLQNMLDVLN
jgi:hypothetical protein